VQSSHLRYDLVLACVVVAAVAAFAASEDDARSLPTLPARTDGAGLYHLGAGDEIKVQQPNAEELDGKAALIDDTGFVMPPLVGRVQLGGLTVEEAELLLASRWASLLLKPQPIALITEYRGQPVSVVGAVKTAGVIQLQGAKTLVEVLSLAGGLREDAGSQVEITRQIAYGQIPVSKEGLDSFGQFSIASIDLSRLLKGENPSDNIVIRPHDVITLPGAEIVYVTGDVRKPGGLPINSSAEISVLQAVSLAEGLGPQASPKNAKILRPSGDGSEKKEIPVNLQAILTDKAVDVNLQPRDILFIPDSRSKKAGVLAAETAMQAITGLAVWGRF
jgi:polysaccharide export outer membrane protein